MNEQKLKNVEQWLEALQELARTAEKALANDTPPGKAPPSLDERSRNLGAAIHKIRELVRPEPKTVAFLEEETWYQMKGAAKPAGEYHTPPAAIDAIMSNPPLGDLPPGIDGVEPRDTPISPAAPKMERGEERYMSKIEAAYILARLATSRRVNTGGVVALQMGVRALMKRHFDRQRNYARRREAAAEATTTEPPNHLTTEPTAEEVAI